MQRLAVLCTVSVSVEITDFLLSVELALRPVFFKHGCAMPPPPVFVCGVTFVPIPMCGLMTLSWRLFMYASTVDIVCRWPRPEPVSYCDRVDISIFFQAVPVR